MKDPDKECLQQKYRRILGSYLREPEERHLLAAADLGHEIWQTGIQIEEMVEIHHEEIIGLELELPELPPLEISKHISIPLIEVMMAYSLAFRSQVEQKEAMQKAQLLQSRKLEAIGRLASGLVHEMGNILAAIVGLASMLESSFGQQHPHRMDVQDILVACEIGQDLMRSILDFIREGAHRRSSSSLNHLVLETVRIVSRTVPPDVKLETRLEEDLAAVVVDSGQISLALMNLTLNAADAMDGSGVIRFTTDNVAVDENTLAAQPELKAGRVVRLMVTDSGRGMDAETQQQAFDPFFTTKLTQGGTGLGLSLVRDTVRSHGGIVCLDSEPGRGTTVTIYLPAFQP